jgi:DNA-binding NtrC family response regulator
MNQGQEAVGSKGGTQGKILVIEDEAGFAKKLQIALSGKGYRMDVATTVQGALAQLRHEHFDLLIVDLCLLESGSMEFIKEVRREHPDTEIIVTSANPSVSSAVQAMKLGVKEYLAEPFTRHKLKKLIVSTLEKRKKAVSNPWFEGKKFQMGTLIQKREVLAVLNRAAENEEFSRNIRENGFAALDDSTLKRRAKTAIISGDLEWLTKHVGELTPEQLKLITKICRPDS